MEQKKDNEKLKAFLLKILKEVRENTSPAVEPDKKTKEAPTVDPDRKTRPETHPRRRLAPDKWPENVPGPKPKAEGEEKIELEEIIKEIAKSMKLTEELIKMRYLISEGRQIRQEMAMNIEDPDYEEPHPSVRAGIEDKKPTAFSDLPFFKGGQVDYTTLEKLGSEEFNEIIRNVKEFGKMSNSDFMQAFQLMSSIEMPNKTALETLAIRKVKEQFGLPDEISDKLEAKLVRQVNKPDDDTDNLAKEVADDLEFTEEEREIIKKHVEKRTIDNALMMGAGFRAHSVFNSIKQDLDAIDERLYPLYQKTMPNVALFMWKVNLEDMMQNVSMMGLSKLKKDENNNVKAEAVAVIFPILLHETAKAAIELLFADYLISLTERFGTKVSSEIIKQSDVFEQEIWHKRIGNTLWKYLHDVIDYVIVHEKEGNYTLVSYLLHDISMMEPDEFVNFMNQIVYDGTESIATISKMIDDIEKDLASEESVPTETDDENLKRTAEEVGDELIQIAQGAKKKEEAAPVTQKNLEDMSLEELQAELQKAVDSERYEIAAQIVKVIKAKG